MRAEAERQLRRQSIRARPDRDRLVQSVTDRALTKSISLSPPPEQAEASSLVRASDGQSIFTVHGSDLFTSRDVLDAETRLLTAGRQPHRSSITADHIEHAANALQTRTGRTLDADQVAFAEHLACSGQLLTIGIGPAGAGKTAALRLLADAAALAGVRVVALAPSARAAAVLAGELDVQADTLHKYLHSLDHQPHLVELRPGDVLLIDEAGMAGTLRLDRLTQLAATRGASIAVVGDPHQLTAVEAGGALRLLAHDLPTAELTTLHRFTHPDEADATLRLRAGDPEGIDFYEDRHRLQGGALAEVADTIYASWLSDRAQGRTSVMLAGRASVVADLSARARLDRIAAGQVDPTCGIRLHDGTMASPGDLVVTRRNDRTTTTHRGRDFVKNGDTWQVKNVRADGGLDLVHAGHQGRVTLARAFVKDSVELAYAATIHRAQGTTVDVAHILIDDTTTRQALYVAATRGRQANHLYAVTDHSLDVDLDRAPSQPVQARDVVRAALDRDEAEKSATQTLRDNLNAAQSLARLVPEYQHVLSQRARSRTDLEPALNTNLGAGIARCVLDDRTWATAAETLSQAADAGIPIASALQDAAAQGGLAAARSPAQMLTWRLQLATTRTARRASRAIGLPGWLPAPPTPATTAGSTASSAGPPEVDNWLDMRAKEIRARVDELVEQTVEAVPTWATTIAPPQFNGASPLLRDVVAYRDQYAVRDRRHALGAEPAIPGQQRRLWRELSQRLELAEPEHSRDTAQAPRPELQPAPRSHRGPRH